MGFASYREDIIDRFNEDLLKPAEELLETFGDRAELAECTSRLNVLVTSCRKIMAELEEYLDLATDPAVKLGKQNVEFRKTISRMKVEYAQQIKYFTAEHARRVAELMVKLGHAKKDVERHGLELNAERKRRQAAEDAVEPLYMDDNDVRQMTME